MTDAFGLGFMVGVGFAFVAIFTGMWLDYRRRR